jgi:glycosyltransferase involved in cell wall biosynthesis
MQKNIVIFCDPPVSKPGTNVGGCHAVVSHMMQQLKADGHQATLYTSEIFAEEAAKQDAYAYVSSLMERGNFDHVHIVTCTRLGLLARRYCVESGLQFTATYDTQAPEYLHLRFGVPIAIAYSYLRWFFEAASCVIVPTESMKQLCTANGLKRLVVNSHGVDTELFQPLSQSTMSDPETQRFFDSLPRPVLLYVGRVTPEKSPQDFLRMDLGGQPHSKIVVGNICGGLTIEELQVLDPHAHFVGIKTGRALSDFYKGSDLFVFPSKTDTFGLVLLEALASGCRTLAYPVVGSIDVITDPRVGCLDFDLNAGAAKALQLSSRDCRNFALQHSWEESIRRFASHYVPAKGPGPVGPHSLNVWADLTWQQLEELINHAAMALWGNEPTFANKPWTTGVKS